MHRVVLISEKELNQYTVEKNLAERTKALFYHQKDNWRLAAKGYESLETVMVREFDFENLTVKVQYNPGRIQSSSARVDEKSISERPCFLCYQNLPAEQKGIRYEKDYLILVNPYPIFPEHFTIPRTKHLPQLIEKNFEAMLNLSKELGKYYTVFYNGPKCGASAPDHMHFQAGVKDFMCIDNEFDSIVADRGETLFENHKISVHGVQGYLRKFISIESISFKNAVNAFEKIYRVLSRIKNQPDAEPMLNILSSYEDGMWRVIIFPRHKHRPTYFYEEGARKLLLSPAAVDLGGVMITPREEDFNKITSDQILDIFRQVSITSEMYDYISTNIKRALS